MIKVVYILIFFSFVSVTSWLEKCNPAKEPYSICGIPEDTIVLNTQAEVDSFQLSLPTGCNCFLGMIRLQGNKINDVSKLSFLRGVGQLEFLQFTSQSELTGFDKLDTVYQNLSVNSSSIDSIKAFKELRYIGGYLIFSRLEKTKIIEGLEKLMHSRHIVFSSNNHLNSLPSFSSLKNVEVSIYVSDNPKLVKVDGFQNLDSVKTFVKIRQNQNLKSINGFNKMKFAGSLTIELNEKLEQISGFKSFLEGYGINISQNLRLEEINAFSNMTKIEGNGLFLRQNPFLKSVVGFNSLKSISRAIEIHNNSSLKTCCPLFSAIQNLSPDARVVIFENGSGCLSREEILETGKCL
ncbi:MAG: hypothetical protein IPL20_13965 [Saprospiraceae bacterium]|nr:hypothetical protein [Saprospiraceae bacterium]